MKINKIILSFFFLILIFSFFQQKKADAACPGPLDTKIYVDQTTQLCYSENDPLFNTGFNTQGGTQTCGQVLCPGGPAVANLSPGNDCIVQTNGQCFAGTGPSGFNTPGCTASSTTPLPQCPSPMDLTVKITDATGKGLAGIPMTVTYEDAPPANTTGQTTTKTTDTTGTALIQGLLYSGDHFKIIPSSPYYIFSPAQIGGITNPGDQEMNTTFSCGTQENGTIVPCVFTATRSATPLPTTNPNSTLPLVNNNTVDNELQATGKTVTVIAGITFVAMLIQGLLGKKK
jgi:hypothetical protein